MNSLTELNVKSQEFCWVHALEHWHQNTNLIEHTHKLRAGQHERKIRVVRIVWGIFGKTSYTMNYILFLESFNFIWEIFQLKWQEQFQQWQQQQRLHLKTKMRRKKKHTHKIKIRRTAKKMIFFLCVCICLFIC